jgi:hypothetical protein
MTIVDLRQNFFPSRSVCKCTNGTDAQDVSVFLKTIGTGFFTTRTSFDASASSQGQQQNSYESRKTGTSKKTLVRVFLDSYEF